MIRTALPFSLALLLISSAFALDAAVTPTDAERFLVLQDGKYGYVDATGKLVIPAIYSVASEFHEDRALFGRGEPGKYGFLDPAGREVIPMQFVAGAAFSDGVAVVEINPTGEFGKGKLGLIDVSGAWIVTPEKAQFKWAGGFQSGLAVATSEKTGEKKGFINKHGEWAIPPGFDWAEPFSEDLAAVDVGGKRGFIDTHGAVAIPLDFLEARAFAGGLAQVFREPGKPLFIDRTGKVVIEPHVEFACAFTDQWSMVTSGWREHSQKDGSGGKWGYMDKTGKFPIELQFEMATPFSEDLAAVRANGKWGYINRRAEWVIPAQFEKMPGAFRAGRAMVYLRKPDYDDQMKNSASPDLTAWEWGYINTQGDFVWRPSHAAQK